jgi:hypothetical protein
MQAWLLLPGKSKLIPGPDLFLSGSLIGLLMEFYCRRTITSNLVKINPNAQIYRKNFLP